MVFDLFQQIAYLSEYMQLRLRRCRTSGHFDLQGFIALRAVKVDHPLNVLSRVLNVSPIAVVSQPAGHAVVFVCPLLLHRGCALSCWLLGFAVALGRWRVSRCFVRFQKRSDQQVCNALVGRDQMLLNVYRRF